MSADCLAVVLTAEEAKAVKAAIALSVGKTDERTEEALEAVLRGISEAEEGKGLLCGAIDPNAGKPGLNAIPYPPRKMGFEEKVDFYDHLIEEGLGKVDLKAVLKRLESLRKHAKLWEDEAKADLSIKAVRELIAECD